MEERLVFEKVNAAYGDKKVLENISFCLHEGEILGIIGETGSGKSTLIRLVSGLLSNEEKVSGRILFHDKDICTMREKELRQIRGKYIGMIFQDAGAHFCPVRTIGSQFVESVHAHNRMPRRRIKEKAFELFTKFGLEDQERIWKSYPFEMSGGMNQRLGIVSALMSEPEILLADEPTSALDSVSAEKVLKELKIASDLYGTSIVFVTHRIREAEKLCDRVIVLNDGRMIEAGNVEEVIRHPASAYMQELMKDVPVLKRREDEGSSTEG